MTTPTREQVIERSRIDFECYFLESRRSKGANRAPTFMRHEQDGAYIDDHTQRHWWTWQQAVNAGREQGLREAKEANADEWQSAMFTIHGYAQGLLMDGQQDMPLYFMKLAELIAKTHVDDAHAERMAQLRAAAIEQLRGK